MLECISSAFTCMINAEDNSYTSFVVAADFLLADQYDNNQLEC